MEKGTNLLILVKLSLNRLENEHLNNVGNYRAVKEVPLPFHEMDSDG